MKTRLILLQSTFIMMEDVSLVDRQWKQLNINNKE